MDDEPRRLKHVEIIERILRPEIAGEALDDDVAHLVHYADLYTGTTTPEELMASHPPGPRKIWYFLSHKRNHDGGTVLRQNRHGGWWRCSRKEVTGDNGLVVGYRRYCRYAVNTVMTKYVMMEYSIPQGNGDQLVLCKLAVKR